MISEEAKTRVLIEETKNEIEKKKKTLDSVTSALDSMNEYHLRESLLFPLWEQKAKAVESYLKAESEKTNQLQTAILEAESLHEDKKRIEAYVTSFCALLRTVRQLDDLRRYDDALAAIAAFEKDDFFETKKSELRSFMAIEELLGYEECFLYCHKGERGIALRKDPLEAEQLERFLALVPSLSTLYRSEKAKRSLIDRAKGFLYVTEGNKLAREPASKELFEAALPIEKDIRDSFDGLSAVAKERANYFRRILLEKYNLLIKNAFDEKRDYEEALYFFERRNLFRRYEISHPAYARSADKKEFRISFLKEEAKRKNAESFAIDASAYCDAANSADDLEFDVLASFLSMDELSEEKEKYLLTSISTLSFELQIMLMGEATRRGMKEHRQNIMLDYLERNEKKECDLEKVAPSLAYCMDHLASQCQLRLEEIIKEIRRSPRAHKIRVKSNTPEVHALFDEDPTNFPAPLGKEMAKTQVKAWSRGKKAAFIVLGLLLPAALLTAAIPLLMFLPIDPVLQPYLLLAPLLGLLLEVHLLICGLFGRDERAGARLRRWLFVDALWKGALALLYILLPTVFTFMPSLMYTLLIFSALEAVWGWLFLKEYKKVWTFILFVPAVLVDLAAVVLLILQLVGK